MPRFHYKAATPRGKIRKGWLEASNLEDLELRLSKMELLLIKQHQESHRDNFFWRPKISRKTLILFCTHMEQLLSSGVSIPQSMEEIGKSITDRHFQPVMTSLIEDIHSGKSLSEAMTAYPDLFPGIFSSMIRVGEKTGQLVEILQGLADNLKWEDEMLSNTRKALRYPLFVGVVVFGLFIFLLTYLAPKLVLFIPEMGRKIPFHTQLLIATSDFVSVWWPLLLLIPAAGFWVILLARRFSPTFHLAMDKSLLRIWFFGPLMRKVSLIRFATTFSLMYRSGISILEAIAINEKLATNWAVAQGIQLTGKRVEDGLSVSASIAETQLFPPPLPRILQVGEDSGRLDSALMNVSYFLNREVRESIDDLQSLIEPVLTVLMGLLLAWVILSILMPIYDTISTVPF